MLFVHLLDLRLFGFVFLFLFVSGMGCGVIVALPGLFFYFFYHIDGTQWPRLIHNLYMYIANEQGQTGIKFWS